MEFKDKRTPDKKPVSRKKRVKNDSDDDEPSCSFSSSTKAHESKAVPNDDSEPSKNKVVEEKDNRVSKSLKADHDVPHNAPETIHRLIPSVENDIKHLNNSSLKKNDDVGNEVPEFLSMRSKPDLGQSTQTETIANEKKISAQDFNPSFIREMTSTGEPATSSEGENIWMHNFRIVAQKLGREPILDPSLYSWILEQKHDYQLFLDREASKMTYEHAHLLNSISFYEKVGCAPLAQHLPLPNIPCNASKVNSKESLDSYATPSEMMKITTFARDTFLKTLRYDLRQAFMALNMIHEYMCCLCDSQRLPSIGKDKFKEMLRHVSSIDNQGIHPIASPMKNRNSSKGSEHCLNENDHLQSTTEKDRNKVGQTSEKKFIAEVERYEIANPSNAQQQDDNDHVTFGTTRVPLHLDHLKHSTTAELSIPVTFSDKTRQVLLSLNTNDVSAFLLADSEKLAEGFMKSNVPEENDPTMEAALGFVRSLKTQILDACNRPTLGEGEIEDFLCMDGSPSKPESDDCDGLTAANKEKVLATSSECSSKKDTCKPDVIDMTSETEEVVSVTAKKTAQHSNVSTVKDIDKNFAALGKEKIEVVNQMLSSCPEKSVENLDTARNSVSEKNTAHQLLHSTNILEKHPCTDLKHSQSVAKIHSNDSSTEIKEFLSPLESDFLSKVNIRTAKDLLATDIMLLTDFLSSELKKNRDFCFGVIYAWSLRAKHLDENRKKRNCDKLDSLRDTASSLTKGHTAVRSCNPCSAKDNQDFRTIHPSLPSQGIPLNILGAPNTFSSQTKDAHSNKPLELHTFLDPIMVKLLASHGIYTCAEFLGTDLVILESLYKKWLTDRGMNFLINDSNKPRIQKAAKDLRNLISDGIHSYFQSN